MKHIKTYEAAGERLFRELEGEGVSGHAGEKCRLWINKLKLKSLRVFRVGGLDGTDPVSLGQAMRFVDLAYDAMGIKPGETGVTVGITFSRPGRPAERFYQIGTSSTGKKSPAGGSVYLMDSGEVRESLPHSIDKITRLISEMGAEIHAVSVSKFRKNYNTNRISICFLEDDWVQLWFSGSVGRPGGDRDFARDLAMTTNKKYRCDGLEGVRQCLDHLGIVH